MPKNFEAEREAVSKRLPPGQANGRSRRRRDFPAALIKKAIKKKGRATSKTAVLL